METGAHASESTSSPILPRPIKQLLLMLKINLSLALLRPKLFSAIVASAFRSVIFEIWKFD